MLHTGYAIAAAARLAGMSVARVRALIDAGVVCAGADDRGQARLAFTDLALLRQLSRLPRQVSARRIGVAVQRIAARPSERGSRSSRGMGWGLGWGGTGRHLWVRDEDGAWEPESGQQLLPLPPGGPPAPMAGGDVVRGELSAAAAEAWHARGRALEAGDDPASACDAYRRALAADPDHAGANIDLGRLVHESGQADAAADLYRAALRTRPDDAVAWFNLGVALGDLGDLEGALASYRRVLSGDPRCADAHYNAARLCERRGDRLGTVRHQRAYHRLVGG